jgi:transcriptional regulator with XRE-family HTH domain
LTYKLLGVNFAAVKNWRRRLGDLLLLEREQAKHWTRAAAARAAAINPGTVVRIERGENYEIAKLEKYALALGRPLDVWLREVLNVSEMSTGEVPVPTAKSRRHAG